MLRLPRATAWLAIVLTVCLTASVRAQYPTAQLTSLFPFGGQIGTTVEVTAAGTDLDDVAELTFSHPGIKAAPKMQPGKDGQPQAVPRVFLVTIAKDVQRGLYEARVRGYFGLSNPRMFAVDSLPEVLEVEPNNPRDKAQLIALETVVNGRVEAEKSDCFKVALKKGQRILAECFAFRADSQLDGTLILYGPSGAELARSMDVLRRDPLLDFTATEDGEYTLELYDFLYKGGDNHGYRLTISARPRVDFVFPPSGTAGSKGNYTLYGRNLPGGEKTELKSLDGVKLEKLNVEIQLPASGDPSSTGAQQLEPSDSAGESFTYRPKFGAVEANPVAIYLTTLPVVNEVEPNNKGAEAQKLTLPCEVAGQFQQRGDQDFFTFDAEKGQVWYFEVYSERLGQTSDPYLIVQRVKKNDKGEESVTEVAGVDEGQKPNQQQLQNTTFDTSHADVGFKLAVAESGTYRVLVRDLYFQTRGSPSYLYRLAIRPPTPDFRLIAVAEGPRSQQDGNKVGVWSPVLQRGGTQGVRVYAQRQDDFVGDIELQAEGLPAGVTCPGLTLGGDQILGTLLFSATDDAASWSGPLKITGRAKINDKDITHVAANGTVVWGSANRQESPVRARLSADLGFSVTDSDPQPVTIQLGEGKTIETSLAAKLEIPIKVTRRGEFKEPLKLAGINLPKDLKLDADIAADKNDGKVTLDIKSTVPPGSYTFVMQTASKLNNYRRNPKGVEKAEKAKAEMDAMVKQADEAVKTATTKKADADKAIATAVASIAKTKTELDAAKAEQTKLEAKKEPAAEPDALKAAIEKTAKAEQVAAEAAKAKADADAAKVEVDKLFAAAAEQKKNADAGKADAEKRVKDATDAAKPKTLNVTFYSTPVTVKIAATPVQLTLDQPTLEIRAAQKLELNLKLNRQFGFAEEVKVTLSGADATGVKAAETTIAKDAPEAKLTLDAGAAPKVGEYHVNVRAKMTWNGQPLQVDVPLLLKVVQ
jgi:hypothetical protein